MLLGPGSGMDSYAGHPLVGTLGVPLVVYPGLKVCLATKPYVIRDLRSAQLPPAEIPAGDQGVCKCR